MLFSPVIITKKNAIQTYVSPESYFKRQKDFSENSIQVLDISRSIT